MAFKDIRLSQWMRVYIDGLPLDLTSKLLPWHTRLNMGLAMHIHAHAAAPAEIFNRVGRSTRFQYSVKMPC